MPTPITAPGRLALLLPWLNGEFEEHVWGPNPLYRQPRYGAGEAPEDLAIKTDFPAIRRDLKDFIRSFDGTAGAGFVITAAEDVAAVDALDDEVIGDLGVLLNIMLQQGFGEPSLQEPHMAAPVSSLRLRICGMGRQRPRGIAQGTIQARRRYREAGAYALRISGGIMDLVPALLGLLLTAADMVVVKKCRRPRCERYIVETAARGARRQFCSGSCRELDKEMEQKKGKKR